MAEFRLGVWSHHLSDFGDRTEIENHAGRLADSGIDLLIPCVKNPPGAVDFLTDLADVDPRYPEWDPLRILIDTCRDKGVEVHPWFCVFAEGEESRLLREHPEYEASFIGRLRWACACRGEVQDYVLGLYKDIAENYKPDGLHLDYIRTGGLCRCEYCTGQMIERGVNIQTVEKRDPTFEAWTVWRTSRITGFVKRLHEFTSSKNIDLSAAVFAGYPDSIQGQGQDWVGWAKMGIVDYLFPMNYTNSLLEAVARTRCHVALVEERVPIWEGLGKQSSISQLSTEALSTQIKGVIGVGAQGIVLFNYRAVTDDDIKAIRHIRSN